MTQSSLEVRELETKLRDLINDNPRVVHSLRKNNAKWNVLCSALDAIGDTELAVNAYADLGEPDDKGLAYLVVYGVLQALFVQQDAARHILKELGIPYAETDPDIEYVRDIRNCATGHPSKRERRKTRNKQTSHRISRISLDTVGFLLNSLSEDGSSEMTEVNIPNLLDRQRAAIIRMLEAARKGLRDREEEHRLRFKDKKLSQIFEGAFGYYFEKIFQGCRGDQDHAFAVLHVDLLINKLSEFRAALRERGLLPAYDVLHEDLENAAYPLKELKRYFAADPANALNEKSAHIFTFYLKHQFERLAEAAKGIDKDYETKLPE